MGPGGSEPGRGGSRQPASGGVTRQQKARYRVYVQTPNRKGLPRRAASVPGACAPHPPPQERASLPGTGGRAADSPPPPMLEIQTDSDTLPPSLDGRENLFAIRQVAVNGTESATRGVWLRGSDELAAHLLQGGRALTCRMHAKLEPIHEVSVALSMGGSLRVSVFEPRFQGRPTRAGHHSMAPRSPAKPPVASRASGWSPLRMPRSLVGWVALLAGSSGGSAFPGAGRDEAQRPPRHLRVVRYARAAHSAHHLPSLLRHAGGGDGEGRGPRRRATSPPCGGKRSGSITWSKTCWPIPGWSAGARGPSTRMITLEVVGGADAAAAAPSGSCKDSGRSRSGSPPAECRDGADRYRSHRGGADRLQPRRQCLQVRPAGRG